MTPTEALAKALHGSFNEDHVSRAGAECGCAYRTDAILSALRDLGFEVVANAEPKTYFRCVDCDRRVGTVHVGEPAAHRPRVDTVRR